MEKQPPADLAPSAELGFEPRQPERLLFSLSSLPLLRQDPSIHHSRSPEALGGALDLSLFLPLMHEGLLPPPPSLQLNC